jgi:hypothetical protein
VLRSTLAIAGITAVLKSLLENGLVHCDLTASIGSDTIVSALPPDRITVGADERTQLNLFLHQVTPNTRLQSSSRLAASAVNKQHSTQPLALDLHYLLTAYGAQDYQIEILLGCALQVMHQMPIVTSDMVRGILKSLASDDGRVVPATLAALAAAELADQIEHIAIYPHFLSSEEMSRLWSALQARYRPSVLYKVSTVLIDGHF